MARITVCDKCGEKVKRGYTATIQIYAIDSLLPLAVFNKEIDLCEICRDLLVEYSTVDKEK